MVLNRKKASLTMGNSILSYNRPCSMTAFLACPLSSLDPQPASSPNRLLMIYHLACKPSLNKTFQSDTQEAFYDVWNANQMFYLSVGILEIVSGGKSWMIFTAEKGETAVLRAEGLEKRNTPTRRLSAHFPHKWLKKGKFPFILPFSKTAPVFKVMG